jgi:hypothetical protein
MREIRELHQALNPVETLFVVDAMQGQDAINTARAFKEALPLTGIVLTKTDGDSRGGAALSVRQVTGAPLKFAGTSEKIDGLEVFDAERHAGRILGMGDIVALVEQVTAHVDLQAAQKLAAKVKSGEGFERFSGPNSANAPDGWFEQSDGQVAGSAGGKSQRKRFAAGRKRDGAQARHHSQHDRQRASPPRDHQGDP